MLLYFFGCRWPPEAAILFGSWIGPGHDNKLHPHRVLALYDLVVDGPLSNHSIQFNSVNEFSKFEYGIPSGVVSKTCII